MAVPLCGLRLVHFLGVVAACAVYKVPSIRLRNASLLDQDSEQTIKLGSGLTSQVIYGNVVALKTFTRESSSTITREAVYESIIKEIRILTHPILSGHANIAGLLFLAWKDKEIFPVLGIEHGTHGSLEYLIRSSWSSLTETQFEQVCRHVTIDIAVGLHAIHKAGFIHGDLKPDNVIVMSHPTDSPRVVAKLTDFGGSSLISGQDGGQPVHFTPLCSPEERADVYSYGLIVGSLWASYRATSGFRVGRLDNPSSCFIAICLAKSDVNDFSKQAVNYVLEQILEAIVSNEIDRCQLRPSTEDLCLSL
ncbi:kinase-like domain-containing protein [Xylaria cf. heliscus]|nr:kinase-like domain-containing protein [Xylaria cf. heliscus]